MQMIDVAQIIELHCQTVELWHREAISNTYSGFLQGVCEQHKFNFLLWHEEDIARSPDVGDGRIAGVKRSIDRYNQQRNDWIEKLDDFLVLELQRLAINPAAGAPLNTETPGSAIDRLSIMALRIYHMIEQTEREDVSDEHRAKSHGRLAILTEQHADLSNSLRELLGDIFSGRKRLKVYRQFKMYNDPAMNPYLYHKDESKKLTG